MMTRKFALITGMGVALALAGCSKKDDKDKGKNTKSAKPGASKTKPGKTKPGAAKSPLAKANVDLKKLIDTETAVPFGEFKKIKLGMTKAEVAKVNPKFVDVMKGHVHGGVTYNAFSGRMMAKGDKNLFKVHTLGVSFYANFKSVPFADVKAALEAKWGKATEHADFNMKGVTSYFWHNPKVGVRAMLGGSTPQRIKMGFSPKVKFQAYMPLDKWLGEPGKPFPFLKEGKPMLGMTGADVKKVYDYEPKQKSASSLPYILRTEWDGDQPPSIMVWVDDANKVDRYTISLKYKDHPKGAAPFVAALKAKYPGKAITDDGKWAQVAANVWAKHEKGWKAYKLQIGKKP